jgi:sugar phosphate isomerase/epimerase
VVGKAAARLIDLFRAALEFGAPKRVRLLVEPHPFTVGMSDRLLVNLCDTLNSPYFGVTFDFCHYGVARASDQAKSSST